MGPIFLVLFKQHHMHACCGVIIWSKFGLFNSYYLVQVCFLDIVCQKHYKNRVSTDLF